MLLGEIRDYLQQRGVASLQDIATHFDIATDTAQFALTYWQRKGKVRLQASSCGGGCASGSCGQSSVALYEWVGRSVPLRFIPMGVRPA